MFFLTAQQGVFIVKLKLEGIPKTEIRGRFQQHFNRRPPAKNSIKYNGNKYGQWGTSLNRHKGNSGRRVTIATPNIIQNVRRILVNNPEWNRVSKVNVSENCSKRIELFSI